MYISLFKRYLSTEEIISPTRHGYPNYHNRIELLAYALMPNHIHILVYQHDEKAMTDLMKSLMISYSMYFNKTHKRAGPLFQSRYLASLIDADNYLTHISRYIHLNPNNWVNTDKSSLDFYLNKREADWINPQRIMTLFEGKQDYVKFLHDYEEQKQIIDELKWELAQQ